MATRVVNKKRLLRQTKKLLSSMAKERREAEDALRQEAAAAQAAIDRLTEQVVEMSRYKGETGGRLDRVKAQREDLRLRLHHLHAELDGSAEAQRTVATLDKAKDDWSAAQAERRRRFQASARQSFLKSRPGAGLARHEQGWSDAQPFNLIDRKFAPLGPSHPEDGVLEWTRFDHKPRTDWKVGKTGGLFSTVAPLGAEPKEDARTRRLAKAGPAKPPPPHVQRHPAPWRAPRSGGTFVFSQPAKEPQPGPMELAERGAASVMARTRYKPEADGKLPWQPTDPTPSAFSAAVPDARWVHQQDTERVAALMTKFGLGPGGDGVMVEEDYVDPDAVD